MQTSELTNFLVCLARCVEAGCWWLQLGSLHIVVSPMDITAKMHFLESE